MKFSFTISKNNDKKTNNQKTFADWQSAKESAIRSSKTCKNFFLCQIIISLHFLIPENFHTFPTEGIFLRPPSLWKSKLSFIHTHPPGNSNPFCGWSKTAHSYSTFSDEEIKGPGKWFDKQIKKNKQRLSLGRQHLGAACSKHKLEFKYFWSPSLIYFKKSIHVHYILWVHSIQPKFPEILVQNRMEQKVS